VTSSVEDVDFRHLLACASVIDTVLDNLAGGDFADLRASQKSRISRAPPPQMRDRCGRKNEIVQGCGPGEARRLAVINTGGDYDHQIEVGYDEKTLTTAIATTRSGEDRATCARTRKMARAADCLIFVDRGFDHSAPEGQGRDVR
jgi:hypothetical protein